MPRLQLLLVALLLIAGCAPVTMAQSSVTVEPTIALTVEPPAEPTLEPTREPSVATVEATIDAAWEDAQWIDLSLGPPLVAWFNRTARPNDIARVDHVSNVELLNDIDIGRKLIVFKSADDAERLTPRLADQMDIIGYNLEHGPANPLSEQNDPVGSVQRMRALADEYDLQLALGPDRRFALSDAAAMAPYLDIIVLQVQRVQTEHNRVRDFVIPLVKEIRAANPEIEISAQVRTEGDVVAIAALIDSLQTELDGVSILTSPETTDIAEALVDELRPPTAAKPPQPTAFAPTQLPKEATRPRATTTPSADETPPAEPTTENGGIGWMAAGFALLALVFSGIVASGLLYGYRAWSKRQV